jgi:GNAT superfamily N-acetyltransferase
VNSWAITAAPASASLDHSDAWAVRGAAAVSQAADRALWGHSDTSYTAQEGLSGLRDQKYAARTWLVATSPGSVGEAETVVGMAALQMQRTGNDHSVFLDVTVHPEHRRRGVGTALLLEAERRAREASRKTMITTSAHAGEPPADDSEALVAPTGARRIHTWNAEENAHMLAINVALGFRAVGVTGMWQKQF